MSEPVLTDVFTDTCPAEPGKLCSQIKVVFLAVTLITALIIAILSVAQTAAGTANEALEATRSNRATIEGIQATLEALKAQNTRIEGKVDSIEEYLRKNGRTH